jgi:hypothetical protein
MLVTTGWADVCSSNWRVGRMIDQTIRLTCGITELSEGVGAKETQVTVALIAKHISLSHRRPSFEQRSSDAVDRVFARPSDFWNAAQRTLMVFAAGAFIVFARRRIGPDH